MTNLENKVAEEKTIRYLCSKNSLPPSLSLAHISEQEKTLSTGYVACSQIIIAAFFCVQFLINAFNFHNYYLEMKKSPQAWSLKGKKN